jgi:N-acetylglucosaminyl-diphospho-decaprenol L-rhamnosyltransferase
VPEATSLVIVSWNSADELPALLESVHRELNPVPERVIVDNGSSDDSVLVARELDPGARILELPENLGYGGGCNRGVQAATGSIVAVMNPDVILVDGSLMRLFQAAASARAIFGPRLLFEDRTPQISAFPPVASPELAAIALWPGALMPTALRSRCEPWRFDQSRSVGWLSGACLVARRSLMLDLGPFDERLHMYGEDIDLCLRAQRVGVGTIFAPDAARIIHIGHRSAGRRFTDRGQRAKISTRTWVVSKNRGRGAAVFDWVCQLVIASTRLVAKSIARRDTGFERTYIRAALQRPVALGKAGQLPSITP